VREEYLDLLAVLTRLLVAIGLGNIASNLSCRFMAEASELYMAFELGEKNWKLALGDGVHSPSRYTVAAGDTAALLECIAKAKARCGLAPGARVGSCYEAGRDGFWLHRWLIEHGVFRPIVQPSLLMMLHRCPACR
jgi:transposase